MSDKKRLHKQEKKEAKKRKTNEATTFTERSREKKKKRKIRRRDKTDEEAKDGKQSREFSRKQMTIEKTKETDRRTRKRQQGQVTDGTGIYIEGQGQRPGKTTTRQAKRKQTPGKFKGLRPKWKDKGRWEGNAV